MRCGRKFLLWRGQNKTPRQNSHAPFTAFFEFSILFDCDGKYSFKTWSLFKFHGNILHIVMELWTLSNFLGLFSKFHHHHVPFPYKGNKALRQSRSPSLTVLSICTGIQPAFESELLPPHSLSTACLQVSLGRPSPSCPKSTFLGTSVATFRC